MKFLVKLAKNMSFSFTRKDTTASNKIDDKSERTNCATIQMENLEKKCQRQQNEIKKSDDESTYLRT